MKRLVLLALPLFLACGRADGVDKKLPSGKSFRILRAGQVKFEKTGQTAAVLVYLSHHTPDQRRTIESDSLDLWASFRPDVEAKGLRTAIIQADCKARSFLPGDPVSVGLVFERQEDGSWKRAQ